jgi:hypothetical protein
MRGKMEERQLTHWRKSTHSTNGGNSCVEVATFDATIAVRDSKDPCGPHLHFSPAIWRTFTRALRQLR